MKTRIEYWDVLKFLLILLVVYGHLLEQSPAGSFNRAMFNFIYVFHMPLFVFVSGRFSQINDTIKYKKNIFRLLESFILFQIIWSLIDYFTLKETSVVKLILVPRWTLWYLLSLVFWRTILLNLKGTILFKNKKMILVSTLIISILGGFLPVGGTFSAQRTITFLPFFMLGFFSYGININDLLSQINKYVAFFFLIALFLTIFYFFNFPMGVVLTGDKFYWKNSLYEPQMLCIYRMFFMTAAFVTGMMIMKCCCSLPTRKFSKWGHLTLLIYLYHTFFVKAYRLAVYRYDIHIGHNELLLPLIAMAIVAIIVRMSRLKLFKVILNPITYITKI